MQIQVKLFRLSICLLFIAIFGVVLSNKLLAGGVPEWFIFQFQETWLGKFPLSLQYWLIALVELSVASLFVAALIMREPFKPGPKTWMGYGLLGASGLFTMLAFGQHIAFDFSGATSSFTHAFGALALWFMVNKDNA